jgi:hypothetical protein
MYDLPDDSVPADTSTQFRKRTALSSGRLASFTKLWEYEDEGNLAHPESGCEFQEPPSKRKKAALSTTLKEVWEDIGAEDDGQHKRSASLLPTPPDSGKRTKTGVGSLTAKVNQKKKSLFENSAITKPTSAKLKEASHNSIPKPIRSYQGLTTVKDKVKSTTISLSQTTMEKLAAFRFKSSSDCSVLSSQPVFTEVIEDIGLEYEGHSVVGHIPTSILVSGKEASDDSARYMQAAGCVTFAISAPAPAMPPQELQAQWVSANSSPHQLHSSEHFEGGGFDKSTSTELVLLKGIVDGFNIEPDEEFRKTLNGFCKPVSDVEHRTYQATIENSTILHSENYEGTFQHVSNARQEQDQASTTTSEPRLPTLPRAQHIENYDIPQLHEPVSLNMTYESGAAHEIQVEHSDLDEYELVPHSGKDLYRSDKFDDGINDEDLLARVSDAVLPQTSSKSVIAQHHTSEHRVSKQVFSPKISVSQDEYLLANGGLLTKRTSRTADGCHQLGLTLSPQVLDPESDDQFPIEIEDEQDMLMLPEHDSNVNKPPLTTTSIQGVRNYNSECDDRLSFSSPQSRQKQADNQMIHKFSTNHSSRQPDAHAMLAEDEENWGFMFANQVPRDKIHFRSRPFTERQPIISNRTDATTVSSPLLKRAISVASNAQTAITQLPSASALQNLDDSHEYEPFLPFARPPFASPVRDRCPVIGLSAQTFLRTCFRIGELFQVGAKCNSSRLDAVIEFFARVSFSSRESDTTKQHFRFLDLWHDRPPYANGILSNFKATGLAESESKVFLLGGDRKLARILGRLKRGGKKDGSWKLDIINIRQTDWEEIRWTRRIVSGDNLVKQERELHVPRL